MRPIVSFLLSEEGLKGMADRVDDGLFENELLLGLLVLGLLFLSPPPFRAGLRNHV